MNDEVENIIRGHLVLWSEMTSKEVWDEDRLRHKGKKGEWDGSDKDFQKEAYIRHCIDFLNQKGEQDGSSKS